jgi:hypothetical protein
MMTTMMMMMMVVGYAYFNFCVLENIPKVLCDAVLGSQVLLSEINCLLVAKNGGGI